MTVWALINDGVVRELTTHNPAGRFHSDLVWVQCDGTAGVATGWNATETAGTWKFTAPALPTEDTRELAQSALRASDIVVLRCYEHGLAVPVEWQGYRAALRAIVARTSVVATLPVRPAYPNGS